MLKGIRMSKTITIQDTRLIVNKISGWWSSDESEAWKHTLFILVDGQILEFEFENKEDIYDARYDLKMAIKED